MGSSNVVGKTHIKLHFDYLLKVYNKFKHAYHVYIVVLQGCNPAITIQEQFCFQIHVMSTCLTNTFCMVETLLCILDWLFGPPVKDFQAEGFAFSTGVSSCE